jgi:hypothetical protein
MRDLVSQDLIEVSRKTITIKNRRDDVREGDDSHSGNDLVEVSRRVIVIRNRQALESAAGMS